MSLPVMDAACMPWYQRTNSDKLAQAELEYIVYECQRQAVGFCT